MGRSLTVSSPDDFTFELAEAQLSACGALGRDRFDLAPTAKRRGCRKLWTRFLS